MAQSPSAQPVAELTPEGIRRAREYLASLRNGENPPFPHYLLEEAACARPVTPTVYVEQRSFANRREAGEYLSQQLAPLGTEKVTDNPALWSWLGMFYFMEVVNRDAQGNPRLGRNPDVAYIIDPEETGRGSRRHFAHRLMLSWEIYVRHGERAWYLLDEPVNTMRQIADRLSGAPEMFRSVGVVELAHRLYADPESRQIRSGVLAGGGNQYPPGGIVRLLAVLNQLYMTYDVYGMTAEQLMELLPPEFDRWSPAPRTGR